jgi:hypothetical protein
MREGPNVLKDLSQSDRRKIWLLAIGGVTYSLILLNDFNLLRAVPVPVAVLGVALNASILGIIVATVRKIYRRRGDTVNTDVTEKPQDGASAGKRTLWVAAGVYFVVMMIGLQFASRLPYQLLALAGIANMGIILTFVVKLRTAYVKP